MLVPDKISDDYFTARKRRPVKIVLLRIQSPGGGSRQQENASDLGERLQQLGNCPERLLQNQRRHQAQENNILLDIISCESVEGP